MAAQFGLRLWAPEVGAPLGLIHDAAIKKLRENGTFLAHVPDDDIAFSEEFEAAGEAMLSEAGVKLLDGIEGIPPMYNYEHGETLQAIPSNLPLNIQ